MNDFLNDFIGKTLGPCIRRFFLLMVVYIASSTNGVYSSEVIFPGVSSLSGMEASIDSQNPDLFISEKAEGMEKKALKDVQSSSAKSASDLNSESNDISLSQGNDDRYDYCYTRGYLRVCSRVESKLRSETRTKTPPEDHGIPLMKMLETEQNEVLTRAPEISSPPEHSAISESLPLERLRAAPPESDSVELKEDVEDVPETIVVKEDRKALSPEPAISDSGSPPTMETKKHSEPLQSEIPQEEGWIASYSSTEQKGDAKRTDLVTEGDAETSSEKKAPKESGLMLISPSEPEASESGWESNMKESESIVDNSIAVEEGLKQTALTNLWKYESGLEKYQYRLDDFASEPESQFSTDADSHQVESTPLHSLSLGEPEEGEAFAKEGEVSARDTSGNVAKAVFEAILQAGKNTFSSSLMPPLRVSRDFRGVFR